MLNALRLYGRYVGVSVRSQMQYRASFVVFALGHFIMTGLEFLVIWALVARFGSLSGWALPEVALFYGLAHLSFALAEGVGRGFDTFSDLVRSGDFDRLLLRPRSSALQVAGREIQLLRVGRFAQGLFVLVWAATASGVRWTIAKTALVVLAVMGGTSLFLGLFVLQATASFWTVDSLELMNTVTYGGVETAQYPLTVYRDWFRGLFTFVVPLASVTYFPALAILGRRDPLGTSLLFQCLAPLTGVAFLVVALQLWQIGVRHYRSTGS